MRLNFTKRIELSKSFLSKEYSTIVKTYKAPILIAAIISLLTIYFFIAYSFLENSSTVLVHKSYKAHTTIFLETVMYKFSSRKKIPNTTQSSEYGLYNTKANTIFYSQRIKTLSTFMKILL